MKTSEIRAKSTLELEHELKEAENRLFGLRMDLSTRKTTSHHRIREARRHIARVKTLITEAQKKEVKDA
jgi:large subunit ribosomal protein L29